MPNFLITLSRALLFWLPVFLAVSGSQSFGDTTGGGGESAQLQGVIQAGELAIDPQSIAGTHRPVTGTAVTTEERQRDAIVFRLEGIRVTDFNGDGRGFRLSAVPSTLEKEGPEEHTRRVLPVGRFRGFMNPSLPENCVIKSRRNGPFKYSLLTYREGSGVDLEVDLEVAYDIPPFAAVGEYTGVVSLNVYAE